MTTPKNDEWVIDCGDPSVGIFGCEASHEACQEWDEDKSVVGEEEWEVVGLTYIPQNGYTNLKIRRRITCGACGATMDVYDWDIIPHEEEANAS